MSDPWYPAAPGIPDAEQRLRLARRIFDESLCEIAVFENGTMIVRAFKGRFSSAEEVLAIYDVPFDGEGSPFGDIDWTPFDDGTVIYTWKGTHGGGFGIYLATREELVELAGFAVPSPTEVFQGGGDAETMQFLRAGLAARHRRTLDAQGKKRVATSEGTP